MKPAGDDESSGFVQIHRDIRRVTVESEEARDAEMEFQRQNGFVAHHIYVVDKTGEEILTDDRIILTLEYHAPSILKRIIAGFHLEESRRMGESHFLRLTNGTGESPLQVSNRIAEWSGVRRCTPHILIELKTATGVIPALYPKQWYLESDENSSPYVVSGADISAPQAWATTKGKEDIVVAVIDDGFDLEHPAFTGVKIHPDQYDFRSNDQDANSDGEDFHGTPVAAIAIGAHSEQSPMRGIAPHCTFLPIRKPQSGPLFNAEYQDELLEVFQYASDRADVVNFSFSTYPKSYPQFTPSFVSGMTKLTESGGRRGKGLVIVIAAGNDDAPTHLEGAENVNGVKFVSGSPFDIYEIPAGESVFTEFAMIPGVIVAAATSSLNRKAGYSSWGPHITVAAPSNNMHFIPELVQPGLSDEKRALFVADYPGEGQVSALNRPGHGWFGPGIVDLRLAPNDDTTTPSPLIENYYTQVFGGTSGAAPIVCGVAALMLSVNSELTAADVSQLLRDSADKNLDPTLDLASDPNVQNSVGDFDNGISPWFGAGKVNADNAVKLARNLYSGPGVRRGLASPELSIPDSDPMGIASEIEIDGPGIVSDILVEVDIGHPHRGCLSVTLSSPQGRRAILHWNTGAGADDLRKTYRLADTKQLQALVDAQVDGQGVWTLHVANHSHQDAGALNFWRLDLDPE
jgi:subtilisin family serine protease